MQFDVYWPKNFSCIYVAAGGTKNKTYEIEFTDVHIGCPRQYSCVYNPGSKEPQIGDVLKSLKSAVKGK